MKMYIFLITLGGEILYFHSFMTTLLKSVRARNFHTYNKIYYFIIYVCIYVCMYVCIHVYICMCIFMYIFVYMYVVKSIKVINISY